MRVARPIERHNEILYLPSYTPKLNPDERLKANLNQAIGLKVHV